MNTESGQGSRPTNEPKPETKTAQEGTKSKCGCGYHMVDCLECEEIKPLGETNGT